ncbi:PREDICTED: heme-binding protein 2-like [Branchiostoma belcheri]|uniref:Heme-binding protein 2-like n=1 Tax=Branchiostoma belcheri TaxID=7741 RepID=A0A6P5APW6_BRABE|nr:PREDICTED: heme-binding protein 2-like [Branchiostoma belcheri]
MLSLLILTTVAGLAAASPTRTSPPTFCHGQDCPRYSVVTSTADYEERLYEPAKWTSASISGSEYSSAVSAGFGKLFQYISGNNKDQAKIPMTVPVLTKVKPGQGSSTDFTVSFFVPFADQTSPPEPSDPTVFTNPLPQMTAYVRYFSGYAHDGDWANNAAALAQSLDNATVSYHKDFYYTAGYNSPFQPTDRHNEVWFIKAV